MVLFNSVFKETIFFLKEFFDRAGGSKTVLNTLNALDDPKEVAQRGSDALIKSEHRAYGSTKVNLLVGVGQVIPNEIIAKITRLLMETKKESNFARFFYSFI